MVWFGVLSLVATGRLPVVQAKRLSLDVEADLGAPVGERGSLLQVGDDMTFPCDRFPKGVVKCDGSTQPAFLAGGSFGNTWLAEDFGTAEEVVIKLFFHFKAAEPGGDYVTGGTREYLDDLRASQGSEVRHECLPVKLVYEQEPRSRAQRICRCLGDNIDDAADDEVLYLKLKSAGRRTLASYHGNLAASGKWTVDLARKIIKQLLEGLDALSRLPWVHHDLHPWNMMVRELEGGEPALQIIDFGCSLPGKREAACDFLPGGNAQWMPPEHFVGEEVCPNPLNPDDPSDLMPPAFNPDAPAAFDAYSAGVIMVNVLFTLGPRESYLSMFNTDLKEELPEKSGYSETLYRLFLALANALGDPSKAEVVKAWEKEVQGKYSSHKVEKLRGMNFTERLVELRKPAAFRFLREAAGLLRVDPKERPSVSSLLKLEWMEETIVADNPHA